MRKAATPPDLPPDVIEDIAAAFAEAIVAVVRRKMCEEENAKRERLTKQKTADTTTPC